MIEAVVLAASLYTGKGAELPEYRGSHYTARAERVLECVANRESGWPRNKKSWNASSWRADGPYGSGAFQMIKSTSAHGARLAGYPEWADKRAYEWPPYVQTEVAYVLLNPYPKKPGLEGLHHWDPVHALTIGVVTRDCSGA